MKEKKRSTDQDQNLEFRKRRAYVRPAVTTKQLSRVVHGSTGHFADTDGTAART